MKKGTFLIILILFVFSSCTKKEQTISKTDFLDTYRNSYIYLEEEKQILEQKALTEYYETLTDEERVGQLFLISLDGNEKEDVSRVISANKYIPGGYLLFAFNIPETAEKTIAFLSEIQNEYISESSIPPFISIDHEGGVVNRLRTICSKLPSQLSVAQKFSENEAIELYELHGLQLKNLGIQVNLAPVVEVLTEENILFLDDRSYGDLENVITYSKTQIQGMDKAGVLSVLKHFPGNTNNDPHTGLPILDCDYKTLEQLFLAPFEELTKNTDAGVLVAHTVSPAIDDKPACLSEKVISLLSDDIDSFDGLVFSDDLLMKALIRNGYPVETSLIDAINAGVNILMISTSSYDEYADIVLSEYRQNENFRKSVDESVKKIIKWKISCGLLEKTVSQTGYFDYHETIGLPALISEEAISKRLKDFEKAYSEASELYNDVWWSK